MDDQFRALLIDRLKERGALAKLAKASGIKSPVIGHWARGETRPSPKNLERLAPALGVPYEDLMKMCGYLPGEADIDLHPRLAAFLSQVEMAFNALTDQEWQIREEAGRALFTVPATSGPMHAKTHQSEVAKTRNGHVNGQSTHDDDQSDNPLRVCYRALMPRARVLAVASL